jgi:hypothetical protein
MQLRYDTGFSSTCLPLRGILPALLFDKGDPHDGAAGIQCALLS